MNKKLPFILGGVLAALLLVAGAVTAAHAQDDDPPTPRAGERGPGGPRFGGPGFDDASLGAAAQALGMSTDDLQAALKDGKTLEDLATAAGVDIQTVQDAMQSARQEQLREQINAGVTDGSISQEKANWLLEGLDKGFLDGPGFGFGLGPGMHGPRPEGTPAAGDGNQ